MKKFNKILSLLLALAMVVSVALTGCSKSESAIAPPDEVAVAMFKLFLQDDASAMTTALGYESEEAARADIMGEDGGIYDEMANQLMGEFESLLGVKASEEDARTFLDAFLNMMGKLEFSAEVKEMDEKARTAVVTCSVSTLDSNAFYSVLQTAAANLDPSLASDPDALVSAIILAMADAMNTMEPQGEMTTFDTDFSLEIMETNGKPQRVWIPTDAAAFGQALGAAALGG